MSEPRCTCSQPRCLKTLDAVKKALQKLAETRKVAELKEQIRIRVVGLAWEDLKTAWSKGGDAFGSAHLLAHLKLIIAEQSKRPIPTTPPVPIMERKALPQLGTQQDYRLCNTRCYSCWVV